MTDAPAFSKPKKTGHSRWALVPVALLAGSFFGVGGMALIAVRDPNFALEPNYYQKALHWDQSQAQAASNQRFGYTFHAPPVVVLDALGQATLRVEIKDRNGLAVPGARLSALGFANAFSEDSSQLQLSEQAPGVYEAQVKARHAGLWEFRLTMDSGADHATAILRCDLTVGGAA